MTAQGIRQIWSERPPLIGMVHLAPLPGSPRWQGAMQDVLDRAVRDAGALAEAGFDGLIVENYSDVPFHRGEVPPATVAAMTSAVLAVRETSLLPVGVNVLRNDAAASLAIAAVTGARFVRVNVHSGSMWTDQGLVEGRAAETLRQREELGAEAAILADVHVKHATPPVGSEIGSAAADAWRRGLADALIVSGTGTGAATNMGDLRAIRVAVPEAVLLVGSGITEGNVAPTLTECDGLIVGSAVMSGGVAGAGVDGARAKALVAAARG